MNIVGRLTRDAEVRTTSTNKQLVSFSVAENDSYKNKQGERIQQTTYFNCSYWLSTNVAKILTKGTLVEISGRIIAKAWTDKDGIPKAGLDFNTSKIKLYGGGTKEGAEPNNNKSKKKGNTKEIPEDDLPF